MSVRTRFVLLLVLLLVGVAGMLAILVESIVDGDAVRSIFAGLGCAGLLLALYNLRDRKAT